MNTANIKCTLHIVIKLATQNSKTRRVFSTQFSSKLELKKRELLKIFRQKLKKLVSKLELKLQKWK